MHTKYASQGLEILAFLNNQCDGQEPCGPAEKRKLYSKADAGFRVMEKASMNAPDEHSVHSLLKQGGQQVHWNHHSKFLVACGGERCTVSIFDGVMPTAMNADIEDALSKLAK